MNLGREFTKTLLLIDFNSFLMRIIFLYILLGVTTCNRTPDVLMMSCPNQIAENCLIQTLNNDVEIIFKDALSSSIKNQHQVGVFCDILNNSEDTIIFRPEKFMLLSDQTSFLTSRFEKLNSQKLKLKLYDSILKIPPNESFENYVLTFRTHKKKSIKEYNKTLSTNTFKLSYEDKVILFLKAAEKAK